jgi:hypothetical protein
VAGIGICVSVDTEESARRACMRTLLIFAFATMAGMVIARSQTTNAVAPTSPTFSAPAVNPSPPPSAPPKKSAAELEKLAEPIALHPDPLIAVILPAAAYPLEIVQAARFVKDTNNIAKLDSQPWDDNVKAVARFPEVIGKMDADLPVCLRRSRSPSRSRAMRQPLKVLGEDSLVLKMPSRERMSWRRSAQPWPKSIIWYVFRTRGSFLKSAMIYGPSRFQ